MPRDIINQPQFEARIAIDPSADRAQTDAVALETIKTQPEQVTQPRALQPGEVVPEGQEPPQESVEQQVPLTRERALQIFSERTGGRALVEGEGVFEVVRRENDEIHSATRIDAGATDPNARAATTRTQPGTDQPNPEVVGQTAPVMPSPQSQERPQGDANRSTDPTQVAPGQVQPSQQSRKR